MREAKFRLVEIHHIGGFPAQMLAAIDADHLPCHGRRIEEKPKRRGDIGRIWHHVSEWSRRAGWQSFRRFGARLAGSAPGRWRSPAPAAQDPCAAVRVSAQSPILAKRVGHELGRQLQHALVDHVQHHATGNRLAVIVKPGAGTCAAKACVSTNGARRLLSIWRSQLLRVAVATVSYSKIEALLTSTVSGPPKALHRHRHQLVHLAFDQQIGTQGDRLAPHRGNLFHHRLGLFARTGVVHGHIIATPAPDTAPSRGPAACPPPSPMPACSALFAIAPFGPDHIAPAAFAGSRIRPIQGVFSPNRPDTAREQGVADHANRQHHQQKNDDGFDHITTRNAPKARAPRPRPAHPRPYSGQSG